MGLSLSIGKEELRIVASPVVLSAIAARYGPFVITPSTINSNRTPIILEVLCRPDRFAPGYERPVEALAMESSRHEIVIGGGVRGHYSIAARRGVIEDVSGLGAVDAFVRIVLSVALPLDGALLVDGAAFRNSRDGGLALCGSSGSGKSTAAKTMGASCDEFVVLRRTTNDVALYSTPYWNGRPYSSRCDAIVFLGRGGNPGFQSLSRAAAIRFLARHVIRYVAVERIDRIIFDLLCSISERVAVYVASCPEGDQFIPFLRDQLSFADAA